MSNGRFVPVPGGVLITADDGVVVGAVGVSGDTSDKDEMAAINAVKASNFNPLPAEPSELWQSSKLDGHR